MIVNDLPDEFKIYERADTLSCTFSEIFRMFNLLNIRCVILICERRNYMEHTNNFDHISDKYIDELKYYVKEADQICDELKMPVMKDITWYTYRKRSEYGCCHRIDDKKANITINTVYFKYHDQRTKEYLLSTIIHELIHTIKGCNNHGDQFMKYVNLVNDHYKNLHLAKTNDSKILQKDAKYIFKCQNCGQLFYYDRKCQFVIDVLENNGDNVHICSDTARYGQPWGLVLVERVR